MHKNDTNSFCILEDISGRKSSDYKFKNTIMAKLLTFVFCVFSLVLSAQNHWENIQVVDEDAHHSDSIDVGFHDSPEFTQKQLERSIPNLKPEYTGYAIELIASDHLLKPNDSAFRDFGKIFLDQSSNKYRYLILIDYRRRKPIKRFYRKIIKTKAPDSKVVQYLNGVKTTEFSW